MAPKDQSKAGRAAGAVGGALANAEGGRKANQEANRVAAPAVHAVEHAVGGLAQGVGAIIKGGGIAHAMSTGYNFLFKTPGQTSVKAGKKNPLAFAVPPDSKTAGAHPLKAAVASAPPASNFLPPSQKPKSTAVTPGTPTVGGTDPTSADMATSPISGEAEQAALTSMLGFNVPGSIASAALNWYTGQQAAGASQAEMQTSMYGQSWFNQAFPGLKAQIQSGTATPISPSDYMSAYQSVQDLANSVGMAPGFVSLEDFGQMVGSGLSFNEISNRINAAQSSAVQAVNNNPEAAALLSKWYGVPATPGALTMFYLDPQKTTSVFGPAGQAPNLGVLSNYTQAAQGGASAENSGFNKLDQDQLVGMATAGVTGAAIAQAAQGQAGNLAATESSQGNSAPAASEAELLASAAGTGVFGANGQLEETQQQATRASTLAVGARKAAFTGGGGAAGQGAPGTPTGSGYGTQ